MTVRCTAKTAIFFWAVGMMIMPGPVAATDAVDVHHTVLHYEEGRHTGIGSVHAPNWQWQWGDEILTAYRRSVWAPDSPGDPLKGPCQTYLARSVDGGLTWTWWDPENFEGDGLSATAPPSDGVDFTAPGFAFKVNTIYYPEDQEDGFGRYDARNWFYSYDQGASWHGPFTFHGFPWDGPAFDDAHESWGEFATSRTDYVVLDSSTMLVFKSAQFKRPMPDGVVRGQDKTFVARTSDGGRNWELLSFVVPKSDPHRAVMPSTVRLEDGTLLCALRRRTADDYLRDDGTLLFFGANVIDVYQSQDDGESWSFLSRFGDCGGYNGNPPAMIRLRDGRLACAYFVRGGGAGMLKVNISSDNGRSWHHAVHVRDSVAQHNGYPRLFERSDGRLCVVYMGDPGGFDGGQQRHVTHMHATVFGIPEFPAPGPIAKLEAPAYPHRAPELEEVKPGSHVFVDQVYRLGDDLPDGILGAALIATSGADRNVKDDETLVRICLDAPAYVYVAYPATAHRPPAWLDAWTDTGLQVTAGHDGRADGRSHWIDTTRRGKSLFMYSPPGLSDRANQLPREIQFRLFRTPDPLVGDVELGGCNGYETGARTNYFVIVPSQDFPAGEVTLGGNDREATGAPSNYFVLVAEP